MLRSIEFNVSFIKGIKKPKLIHQTSHKEKQEKLKNFLQQNQSSKASGMTQFPNFSQTRRKFHSRKKNFFHPAKHFPFIGQIGQSIPRQIPNYESGHSIMAPLSRLPILELLPDTRLNVSSGLEGDILTCI